jgi:peptidoglycan hydrolase CwlO-like protein
MKIKTKAIACLMTISLCVSLASGYHIFAQTATPSAELNATVTPTSTQNNDDAIKQLNDKIHELEQKVNDLKKQENSLSSKIDVMDNQIQLTQYRINVVQEQINDTTLDIDTATKRIKNLEGSLYNVTKVLLNRIRATYQAGETEPLRVILASNNLQDFLSRENYLRIVQEHDRELLYNTQQAKVDYANQKSLLESKKKKIVALQSQLEAYTKELDTQNESEKKLLAETQGDEENYQRLLAQAKAQLEGFSRFTANQGGASLLSGQTVCDDWGCYYNQRDSQWGGNSLNNTQYTLASDGCLVTSMAMVYTHFGHRGVTPQTINSDPNNFASYYPAFLKYTITADGATATRIGSQIDGELSAGRPVVVGISYDGGPSPDHFLVIINGSNGNYMMNDPYTPNGHNIPLTDKYSVGSIREIDKVNI